MPRDLPPLNAVRAFESAARNASFTRAAAELSVSQGAISRHVAGLEQWLQVKLFTRAHRGIELTPQGRAYFQIVRNALELIESGTSQLKHSPDEQRLRLKLPPTSRRRTTAPTSIAKTSTSVSIRGASHPPAPAIAACSAKCCCRSAPPGS